MTKRTFVAVALVAIGLCVPGCSGGGGKESATTLPFGFVVARNSHLVGGVFWADETWTAVLDIERDPVGVYDAYVAQARKLGVPLPGSGAQLKFGPLGCQPTPPGTKTPVGEQPCFEGGGGPCAVRRTVFRCDARTVGGNLKRIDLTASVDWGDGTRVIVLSARAAAQGSTPLFPRGGTARFVGPVPESPARAPLSTPGRPFGARNDASQRGYRRFTLEPGSRVITDAPESLFAVLEITGDAQEVLTRYARQLAAPDDKVAKVSVKHVAVGGTYFAFGYGALTGGYATFTTDVSHKYARVTWWSD